MASRARGGSELRHVRATDAMAYRRHTPRFEDVLLILAAVTVVTACVLVWSTSTYRMKGQPSPAVPAREPVQPTAVMVGGLALGILSVVLRTVRGDRR